MTIVEIFEKKKILSGTEVTFEALSSNSQNLKVFSEAHKRNFIELAKKKNFELSRSFKRFVGFVLSFMALLCFSRWSDQFFVKQNL